MLGLLVVSGLMVGIADSVAVMSVDLGSEWMKIAVVTVRIKLQKSRKEYNEQIGYF